MSADALSRSVTRGDHGHGSGSLVFNFWPAGGAGGQAGQAATLADLPPYWSVTRDAWLRSSMRVEPMWSAAVAKAISKQVALGWTVDDVDDGPRRLREARELLLFADGRGGWSSFVSKQLRAFLLNDNGSFFEIVRSSAARGSRIVGLVHLASRRCERTDDPQRPVLYTDTAGRVHVLRDHQVVALADLPDEEPEQRGRGFSAASRAWQSIATMAGIRGFLYDRVTGRRVQAIHFVSGTSPTALEAALSGATGDGAAGRAVRKGGVLVIPVLGDILPQVATVPISEIPEGFDVEQERNDAYTVYANALGVAVQEIKPLSGQGLGTGTQTVILAEAAEALGLAAWRRAFTHALNEYVLVPSVTFSWSSNDVRDQVQQAEAALARAQLRQQMIANGEIDADQARRMAVEAGDLPREMLLEAEALDETLEDDEQPLPEQDDEGAEEDEATAPLADDETAEPVTKATLDELWDEELARARRVARAVMSDAERPLRDG